MARKLPGDSLLERRGVFAVYGVDKTPLRKERFATANIESMRASCILITMQCTRQRVVMRETICILHAGS